MGIVISPDSGEVYVEGQKASGMNDTMRCRMRNQYFGYIVQDFALIEEDTAMQNILVPTLYSKHKKSSSEYRKLIYSMAEKLQVSDKLKSTVKKLSGGERQRIAIIRSMVCDQKIILADEPTGSLDKDNSTIVMKCLRELVDDFKKTVVIVTHDLNVARQCDRTFNLTGGVLTPCNL
jgi:putative ABC transport system ATP-binding protein